jgi:two-component system alkaline phosphatase synthesis response regulator PhoP
MKNLNVLILEDHEEIGETLKDYFFSQNANAVLVKSIADFMLLRAKESFALFILDINLPDGSGIDIIEMIKKINSYAKIICLSAQNDAATKILALKSGADDYMTKPFDLDELTFRINKLTVSENIYQFGEIIFYPTRLTIQYQEQIFSLTKKESDILEYLILRSPHFVSRDELIDKFWDDIPSTRTVDNYIVKFRKYFSLDNNCHISISSIRGIGYQLKKEA